MATYIMQDGELVEVVRGPRQPSRFPMISSDLPAYRSPCGTGWIEGRAARREDLKRNNCIEVGPGDMKPKPITETPQYVKDWQAGRGVERTKPE